LQRIKDIYKFKEEKYFFDMIVKEDLVDLPLNHKITTSLILAGSYFAYSFFDELKPIIDQTIEYDLNYNLVYKKLSIEALETLGIGLCTNLSLQALDFMKKPRLKNLFATLIVGLPLSLKHLISPSEKSLESLIIFSESTLNHPNPNSFEEDRAKLHLMRGELGHAILQYSRYLETEREKISDRSLFSKFISAPLKRLYQARASIIEGIPSKMSYIHACLENGDETTVYEKVWPEIVANNSSLEIKLAHALSLSKSSRTKEATNLWEEIIENQRDKLQKVGESRNEVLEITGSEKLKGTIIIKRGKDLGKEAYVLSEAYRSTPINRLFTPVLVIHYTNGKETLITFRRAAENLDKKINEENSESAMLSLARLHSLRLKLPTYDPLIELNRRLFDRLGHLQKGFPLFNTLRKILETQEGELVTSHCDFYPTNILDDGTIIDLETSCIYYPDLDIENFRSHPNAPKNETAIKKYLELRSEIEGKEIKLFNRHIYRVLCPAFQIGSFYAKGDNESSLMFIEQTLEGINETGLQQLKDPLMYYLDSLQIKALL